MGQLVTPEVYWVGYTEINDAEIQRYLKDSGNDEFWEAIVAARASGLSNAEILCSMFAKLCYKSLTLGHNDNVTRVRDIESNIINCFNTGHGSVFEHVNFNFIVHNCSRVYTHEQVRHRVGYGYSQTSGRYVKLDKIDFVFDPIMEPIRSDVEDILALLERKYVELSEKIGLDDAKNFARKKKLTSALRRICAPSGIANELAITVNLRSLRHTIMMRTSTAAEWEVRRIYQRIYEMLKEKYPLIFYGAKEEFVEGATRVYGMKMQPYEATALEDIPLDELKAEIESRS